MAIWSRPLRRVVGLAEDFLLDDQRDQLLAIRKHLTDGDNEAALAAAQALLAGRPDHGLAHMLAALAYLRLGQGPAAQVAYQAATGLRESDARAWIGLAHAEWYLGNSALAVAAATRALTLAAGERELLAAAYGVRGAAHRLAGALERAIRDFRKAVTEVTGDTAALVGVAALSVPQLWAHLAEALSRHPDADESGEETRRAIDRAPGEPLAALALGRLHAREGALELAAASLTAAATALTDEQHAGYRAHYAASLLSLGEVALRLGDATSATTHLGAAREAAKGQLIEPIATERYAEALAARDGAAALPELPALVARYPTAAMLTVGLKAALMAGDMGQVGAWSRDLLALEPDNVLALAGQGTATNNLPMLELAAARGSSAALSQLGARAIAQRDAAWARRLLAQLDAVVASGSASDPVLADIRQQLFRTIIGAEFTSPAAQTAALSRWIEGLPALARYGATLTHAALDLDQPLWLTVMGEFSAGKSSFVNAFIGEAVAPTGITPTTATINVLRYGRERGAQIHFADGQSESVAWQELGPRLQKIDDAEARRIERVDVLMPLPVLQTMSIVDTPGLNSLLPEHDAVARNFIAKADAIIWLFTAGQAGKATEREALAHIASEGRRVLGVLNKKDQFSDAECAEAVAFAQSQLTGLVETVVPVSTREAILAKKTSGWPEVVRELEVRFFAQARSLKQAAFARRVREVIAQLRAHIDAERDAASDIATKLEAASAAVRAQIPRVAQQCQDDQRRHFADACNRVMRMAAREVEGLVLPRALPFAQAPASSADREYVAALLRDGFAAEFVAAARRLEQTLTASMQPVLQCEALVRSWNHSAADACNRARFDTAARVSATLARGAAYLEGYWDGGYLQRFFAEDAPKHAGASAQDGLFLALLRNMPELETLVAAPVGRAVRSALADTAAVLDRWARVARHRVANLEACELAVLRELDEHVGHIPANVGSA